MIAVVCGNLSLSMPMHNGKKRNGWLERMKTNHRKGQFLAILAILLSIGALVAASTFVYWTKSVSHKVKVVGINASLLQPGFDNYVNKIEAADLDANNQVALAINKENFYNVWLNITQTNNATEGNSLGVTCTGQYYQVYYDYGMTTWDKFFVPYNSTVFTMNMNTMQVIDKIHCMYHTPVTPDIGGVTGYCLVLTFNFNTEGVTDPQDINVSLTFSMGFA